MNNLHIRRWLKFRFPFGIGVGLKLKLFLKIDKSLVKASRKISFLLPLLALPLNFKAT